MKKIFTILALSFLVACAPCHSQTITFMNGIASTASGTYSVVATGKQGNIMISTNAAFNGTTTTDSITPFHYWKGVMTSGVLAWTDTGSTSIPTTP